MWYEIIKCWTKILTGLPNRTIVDQGFNLGEYFIRLASLDGIMIEGTGIEVHKGLGYANYTMDRSVPLSKKFYLIDRKKI